MFKITAVNLFNFTNKRTTIQFLSVDGAKSINHNYLIFLLDVPCGSKAMSTEAGLDNKGNCKTPSYPFP